MINGRGKSYDTAYTGDKMSDHDKPSLRKDIGFESWAADDLYPAAICLSRPKQDNELYFSEEQVRAAYVAGAESVRSATRRIADDAIMEVLLELDLHCLAAPGSLNLDMAKRKMRKWLDTFAVTETDAPYKINIHPRPSSSARSYGIFTAAQRAEADADQAKDAARYRYLRENDDVAYWLLEELQKCGYHELTLWQQHLDEGIDARMPRLDGPHGE